MAEENQYLEKLKNKDLNLYQYFMRGIDIVKKLNEKMHEAYIVGGAVRDYLLNVDFKDIDISTTATPDQVLEIFPDADGRYKELGCVELKEGKMTFQITTFRDEQDVTKRKIKNIHYSKKLTDDVLRRDYTVNALALSSNLNIIDIVKGTKDIKKKRVKVIGKGKKRFHDDPLRIFRGLELVARYNFSIARSTGRAMTKCSKYIEEISNQKLSEALLKILNAKYAKAALYQMADLEIFGFDGIYNKWVNRILKKYKKTNVDEKFALLYYMYGSIPINTCFTKDKISQFEQMITMTKIMSEVPVDSIMLYKYGYDLVLSANQMLLTLGGKYKNQAKQIKKLYKKMPIKSRKELKFTAEELIEMMNGETGPKVSEIMESLTKRVVCGEVLNNNAIIRQEAIRILTVENSYNVEDRIVREGTIDVTTEDKENDTIDVVEKLYEEVTKELPVSDEDMIDVNDDNAVLRIKDEYAIEFKQLYSTYMREVQGYQYLSEIDKWDVQQETKQKVKKELLEKNKKYQVLVERGII